MWCLEEGNEKHSKTQILPFTIFVWSSPNDEVPFKQLQIFLYFSVCRLLLWEWKPDNEWAVDGQWITILGLRFELIEQTGFTHAYWYIPPLLLHGLVETSASWPTKRAHSHCKTGKKGFPPTHLLSLNLCGESGVIINGEKEHTESYWTIRLEKLTSFMY